MAHGESHAKKTVMSQVDRLEQELSNGQGGDPATHGAALLLLLQMVRPIFAARLVTEEECVERCKQPARRVGWPSAAAILGCAGMLVGTALKLWG